VNWSAGDVALVPVPGTVTVTSTVAAGWAGLVATIWLSEPKVMGEGAGTVPNITLVASVNPVPLMTTVVPPSVGPVEGEIPVTVGAVQRCSVRV